jgi:hypothetical protein
LTSPEANRRRTGSTLDSIINRLEKKARYPSGDIGSSKVFVRYVYAMSMRDFYILTKLLPAGRSTDPSVPSRNLCRADCIVRCLQLAVENLRTCPEWAKRVEWIADVAVPVVQRIERKFPKGKMAFLQEWPNEVRSTQLAVFEVVE